MLPTTESIDQLAQLGLEVDGIIRGKREPTQHWTLFTVKGMNADGSLEVSSHHTGHMRSLHPDRWIFEVKGKGPRGGVTWTPLDEVARASAEG